MLRWFFLILLLVNAVLYGWFYQEQEQRRQVADRVDKRVHGVAELDLLSEVPSSALRPRELVVQAIEPAATAVAELYCYRFGPFAVAQGLESWIGEDGPGRLELEQDKVIKEGAAVLYQVSLVAPKLRQDRDKLISSMSGVGLEGEWFEHEGSSRLSLGRYQEQGSAQALRLALQEQGYEAMVDEQVDFSYRYYLLLRSNSGVAIESAWASSLLKKYPTAKSVKKLCQGLATAEGRE